MKNKNKISLPKHSICAPEVLNEPICYPKPVSFSRGIRVDLGNNSLIFISGTASVNKDGKTIHKGNFLLQAKRTFKNLTYLLKSEGATWHNVVRTTCYLKDMRYYDLFNKIRNQFYKKMKLNPLPASTCIEAGLCRPDLLVEIELIAIIKNNGKRK
ncbi:MAG: RidA family protein [Candidatus Omnitrophica bacterium]|nr:RidA family protein [Candidatus Omnitrophota bacterium]